jgi:hypothetical protein
MLVRASMNLHVYGVEQQGATQPLNVDCLPISCGLLRTPTPPHKHRPRNTFRDLHLRTCTRAQARIRHCLFQHPCSRTTYVT